MSNQSTFKRGDFVVYFDASGKKCVSTFDSDQDAGKSLRLSNGKVISYSSIDWLGMSDDDETPEPSDEEMENYEEKRRRKIAEQNEY